MKKCGKCITCSFVKTGKTVKSTASNYQIDINTAVDCTTDNVIYCIECKKCQAQYIGQTSDTLRKRFDKHRGSVTNKDLKKAIGQHYNLPGHSVSDMTVTIVEKVYNQNEFFRRRRETHYIQNFKAKLLGINRIT